METKKTAKYEEARQSLPEELRPVFDELAQDYRFAAKRHHGSPYVSYVVIAEIIKLGWRPSGQPMD